jgi:hypothetical protein
VDYKFLHKVIDQIVSETRIDYDESYVYSPGFFSSFFAFSMFFQPKTKRISYFFTQHCEDVYGLNVDEIEYVWNEYTQIINDKIKNNG